MAGLRVALIMDSTSTRLKRIRSRKGTKRPRRWRSHQTVCACNRRCIVFSQQPFSFTEQFHVRFDVFLVTRCVLVLR